MANVSKTARAQQSNIKVNICLKIEAREEKVKYQKFIDFLDCNAWIFQRSHC